MELSFRHLVSASQVTRPDADFLVERAREMEEAMKDRNAFRHVKKYRKMFRDKCVASLFYEPSTRTRFSFERAVKKFGGEVMTADGFQFSSLYKGESVADNTRVIAGYDIDAIIMRHPHDGSAQEAADALDEYRLETGRHVPFINAGDGKNEHPTQAALDLKTIQDECGRLTGLHVALVGDLLRGRTVHSLSMLLSLYEGNHLTFATPGLLRLPGHVKDLLKARNVSFDEVNSLEPALDADVCYMTRSQNERSKQGWSLWERWKKTLRYLFQKNEIEPQFTLTADLLRGKNTVIMHPLPRNGEIATDIDRLPNAAYFRQARNGLPMRMALLSELMNTAKQENESDESYGWRRAA